MRLPSMLCCALLLACGDDGKSPEPAATCAGRARDFAACGGSLVGTWKLQDFCMSGVLTGKDVFEIEACADTTIAVKTHDPGGTLAFAGDGTYDSDFRATEALTIALGAGCLAALGGGSGEPATLCAQIDAREELSCGFAASTCTCTASQAVEMKGTGSYQIEGGHLVMIADKPANLDYCVGGGKLVVVAPVAQGSDAKQVFVFAAE